jgi:hypothetical protein
VTAIRVNGKADADSYRCRSGKNDVAITVKSSGKAAGPFALRVAVEDSDEAEEKTIPGLDAEKSLDVTFEDVRLKKGTRTLHALADARQVVDESDETNNERSVTVSCKDQKQDDE